MLDAEDRYNAVGEPYVCPLLVLVLDVKECKDVLRFNGDDVDACESYKGM